MKTVAKIRAQVMKPRSAGCVIARPDRIGLLRVRAALDARHSEIDQ
jgi:hypothetical protein